DRADLYPDATDLSRWRVLFDRPVAGVLAWRVDGQPDPVHGQCVSLWRARGQRCGCRHFTADDRRLYRGGVCLCPVVVEPWCWYPPVTGAEHEGLAERHAAGPAIRLYRHLYAGMAVPGAALGCARGTGAGDGQPAVPWR